MLQGLSVSAADLFKRACPAAPADRAIAALRVLARDSRPDLRRPTVSREPITPLLDRADAIRLEEPETALRLARKATRGAAAQLLATPSGEAAVLAAAASTVVASCWRRLDDWGRSAAALREAWDVSERWSLSREMGWVLLRSSSLFRNVGDLELAIAAAAGAGSVALELGDTAFLGRALYARSYALGLTGAWLEAAHSFRLAGQLQPRLEVAAVISRGYCLQAGGQPAAAIAETHAALERESLSRAERGYLAWTIGSALLSLGDKEAARDQLAAASSCLLAVLGRHDRALLRLELASASASPRDQHAHLREAANELRSLSDPLADALLKQVRAVGASASASALIAAADALRRYSWLRS